MANDHPVVVENFETETRFSGSELLTSHDIRSGISTLIGTTDDPWGLIAAYDTNPQTFTEEDVTFVQSVATILADAIERNQYQNDLEQLVADLEESNERLEQFAYAASHDLQEPLRMVSSYLQLIERRYGDELDEDGEEFLEFAVDGADRMRSMIDGLLQYSRVETQGSEFEPVDLENVLDDVREDLRMKIEESDAKITAESLPRVTGDEEQLRQVFQNLLSNAIKYSGEGPPKVHISAGRNGTDWTVSVSDNGIGIDPKDQDRIFEVFEGLHAADDYTGTGIGLAVCERIIERHGGEIWVESEPGEGSTFSVTLPAVTDRFEEYAVE
ncbi:multi-sensor signal transduction histidine kinase [Halobiforma lacisalsi AJ5]|uniref:histidine kinase n=1 Tax=Natronobacterium lacisalsi AJ5 TaxID=358396 RepID=M0LEX5_NATLA|nr:multi-sensor signal transduction histidine kinase [Halobiforma lacisalsi AJ5]